MDLLIKGFWVLWEVVAEGFPSLAFLRKLNNGHADVPVDLHNRHLPTAESGQLSTPFWEVEDNLELMLDHRKAEQEGNGTLIMQHTGPEQAASLN